MEYVEKNLKNSLVLFILFLLGFLVYSNAINGPFLFDDMNFIVYNSYVHSLSNFLNYFNSSLETGTAINLHVEVHNNFYRPLQQLASGILYHFWGLKFQVYHILSIFIHIINSFLLFIFFKRFSFSKIGSFAAALIFLMHPVQIEVVSYISGLCYPMALMFLFSGLLIYLNIYDEKSKNKSLLKAILAAILFCCAMLSVESAFIFCPLTILISIFFWNSYSKEERSFRTKNIVIYIILACLYIYLKLTVFNFQKGSFGLMANQGIPYVQHLYVRIITFISILIEYARLLIYPSQLCLDRPYIFYTTLFTYHGFFGLLIILASLTASVFSFLKKTPVFVGILWFFICLVPYIGLIPLNAIYTEHWLYFPIVGVLIIFAYCFVLVKVSKYKSIIIYALSIVLTLYGARVIERNNEWSNEIKFYKKELVYNPNSQRTHSNLALCYFVEKRYPEAIQHYKIAISLIDAYPECHNNLGVMYMEMGNLDLAENEFLQALKIDPNFIYSINGLSEVQSLKAQNKKL
ncbi:MAG: tetratricopeptide repeat protein [Candidatus Gastranaerophilaceae bacterium]|jgi:hypothetical protein